MLIIGHRGYSGSYPENTLLSFRKALQAGADMLELDVHVSRDRKLVVIHDETLERTTSLSGAVKNFFSGDLMKADAGHGESVPLLNDVLSLAGSVPVNIELKGEGSAEVLSELLAQDNQNISRCLISSFHWDMLGYIRKCHPGCRVGILTEKPDKAALKEAVKLNAWSIHMDDNYSEEIAIQEILSEGFKPMIYTVNNKSRAQQLKDWGVSGIFTDYPREMKEHLSAPRNRPETGQSS